VTGITTLVERPIIVNQASVDNPILAPESKSATTAQVSQPKAAPQFISQSSNSATVSVGINLQERCWLKVMVDSKVAFEGVLPAGTQRQWKGKKTGNNSGGECRRSGN
jgi:hypothetical protein